MAEEQKIEEPTKTPFVNPWHPDAVPPIDPSDPRIGHPTGEFRPKSYIDLGAWSPVSVKFPSPEKKRKHPKNVDKGSRKKVRKNLTLELPETQGTLDNWLYHPTRPTRVRFEERVLVKNIIELDYVGLLQSWSMVPLRGYSLPNSDFLNKREQNKLEMKQRHQIRIQKKTPRRLKIRQHILDTLERENNSSN
jgi:hypothetical protein